jgi:hypothetical protein
MAERKMTKTKKWSGTEFWCVHENEGRDQDGF